MFPLSWAPPTREQKPSLYSFPSYKGHIEISRDVISSHQDIPGYDCEDQEVCFLGESLICDKKSSSCYLSVMSIFCHQTRLIDSKKASKDHMAIIGGRVAFQKYP